jgi:hypothetical protein
MVLAFNAAMSVIASILRCGACFAVSLEGEPPTIDLVIGYSRTNTSPTLALFLSRVDQLKK